MRLFPLALVPLLVLATLEACDKARHEPAPVAETDASLTAAEIDAGAIAVASPDGGRRLLMPLAAASYVASVSDIPAWAESDAGARRLGYLRNGAVVEAYDPPIPNDECRDGWYELVNGGYVCGKVATIDLGSPRVRLAPKQPDRDAGMPYRYGVNVTDGTPLYRRVLGAEDRREFEHPTPAKTEAAAREPEKDEEPGLAGPDDEESEPSPKEKDKKRRGKKDKKEARPYRDPFKNDAGRPLLKELKGRGVLVRKLARGFTIAVDREFKAAGAKWWRTTGGFAVPFEKIAIQSGQSKYSNAWFNGEGAVDLLPFPELALADAGEAPLTIDAGAPLAGVVGFVMTSGAHKVEITDDPKGGKKVGWGPEIPRRGSVLLTGRVVSTSSGTYHQTSDGYYVPLGLLKLAHPAIPNDVGDSERWIDVDLTRQMLVAFEGRRPVFATLISSGRRNLEDKEHDFPTPPGVYRIREKHVTTTMDGDVASDGPYSIEEVPWVMYFHGSYALHGAFWHDSFGNVRSHGCVNMAPDDARTLFNWAEPRLPDNWHGVFSKDENSGSRVIVHEDPKPKRR